MSRSKSIRPKIELQMTIKDFPVLDECKQSKLWILQAEFLNTWKLLIVSTYNMSIYIFWCFNGEIPQIDNTQLNEQCVQNVNQCEMKFKINLILWIWIGRKQNCARRWIRIINSPVSRSNYLYHSLSYEENQSE